jgi:2-dehydro-3-deoxyphosphogluconate aldolase / (4S)-4-hydroxy-2-oxoglutarate aldolase
MEVMAAIRQTRVIAILRASRADRFREVASALFDAGIPVIEFTFSSKGTLDALREFAADTPPGLVLGAGTLLDERTAAAAVEAGARFLVTPGGTPEVIQFGRAAGVPVLPGALTAGEVLQAWRAGASAVKVFPASMGGPDYIAALRGPLPDIPLVPTGGVTIEATSRYLKAGALAVGIGGPLIGDAAAGGSLDALRQRAAALVEAVQAAGSG